MELRQLRYTQNGDAAQKPMDRELIVQLSFSQLEWPGPVALPALLVMHLGVVMALSQIRPYGKSAHGIFHGAAQVGDQKAVAQSFTAKR